METQGNGEIKLVFIWKLHPYWQVFKMPEGAMHATLGEKESPALPSCELCELLQQLAWHDMTIVATVA